MTESPIPQFLLDSACGLFRLHGLRYVAELVEAGLILTKPTKVTTKDGQRWNGNLKYTLLPIESAVELFHERQLAKLETGVQRKRKAMMKATQTRERKQIPHAE